MSDPLSIGNEMRQFDLKNRDFYRELNDEQKKKFAPFLMVRWGSTVDGDRELQEFYVRATNKRLNRWLFAVPHRHKELQWLLATTVSPGMGARRHAWIAPRKKSGDNKHRKAMAELYPHLRDDELDVMCEINTPADVRALRRDMGEDK